MPPTGAGCKDHRTAIIAVLLAWPSIQDYNANLIPNWGIAGKDGIDLIQSGEARSEAGKQYRSLPASD